MANHERQSRPPGAATSLPDSPAPDPSRSTKPRLLRRLLAPALVACIGIVAGLVLFNMLHSWELDQATREFQGDAQERVAAFERHMALHLRSLHTAEAFVLSSEKVDREALSTFADVLLKPEPERQQLGWIDRVPGAQRQAYEQARRDDGLAGFEIGQWRDDGHTVMPEAEEYFPISVIQPPVAWPFPGLDLSSNPACRAALEQARDTGVMIATAPFHLTEEKSDRHNMVIFLPVYAKDAPTTSTAERRENLVGFIFGKYFTEDILDHAFERLTPEGVDVLVLDPSAIPEDQFLGVHWSRLGGLPAQTRSLDPTIWRDDKLCQETTLEIAGRSFLVLCKPAQGLIAAKMTWIPWLSMLSTWGLTLLLVAYLQTIRTARSRTEVLAMELADANENLLREMHERESADAALRENEANLRFAQELAHVGSWSWTLASGEIELSDEMRRIYGLPEEEEVGDINSLIDASIHPDDRELLHRTSTAIVASEITPPPLTFRIIRPNGQVRSIVATASQPIRFDDDGNPLVMMGTVHDITDRVHAENALRESQQRLKALVENIPGVAYRCACDEHWTMDIVSKEIKQLCGYPASDFIANAVRSFASIIHPDDVKMVTQAVLESVDNRRPYVVAYRLLNADGLVRWVLDNGQGVFDDEQLLWLDGVIVDITAQKEAEQALRESEKRYRAIFEGASEGILIADAETAEYRYANPKVCSMLGYSLQELLALKPEQLHPPDQLAMVMSYFHAQAASEIDFAPNIPFLRRDGQIIYADVSSATLTLDGRPCTVGFLTDVTERRQAEQRLRDSEERHRTIFESSRDAIMTLAPPSWKFTSGNQATVEMFKATDEEELVSLSPSELSPEFQPDGTPSAEKSRQMIETAMREGSCLFDWTHKRVGGEEFPATVLLTRMELGGQTLLQATVRDITDRVEAEQALRDSEAGLKQAQQLAHVGSWEWDLGDNSFEMSDEMRRIHGLSPASNPANVRALVEAMVHPDNRQMMLDAAEAASSGEALPEHTTFRIVRPNGEMRWVIATRPVPLRKDADDKPTLLMGTLQDITEQKAAEEAMREGEKRYRQLVESLSEGIVAMDRDGIITFVNSALERILDDRAEMLLGSDFFGSINTFQKENFRHSFTDKDVGGQEFQLVYLRRDGKLVYLSIRGSAISDDEGNHVGTLAVINDITQRRMAEESLKAAHRQLMFAGEEERHALATDLHDSLGQQAVALHLTIENLLGRARKADSAYTDELAHLSQTCQSLTEDIRTACHGLFPPALETLGLCAALRRLVSDCQGLIDVKMTCCPKCDENPRLTPDVEIALFRIAQEAINNVLRHGNAKDLELTMKMTDDDVIMTVANDGDGFDVEQAESSGLGLLTMRERANAVNGSLTVSSVPGRTTVVARVPMPPLDG